MKYVYTILFISIFSGCATWDGVKQDSSEGWEKTKEVSGNAWDKTKKAFE